MLDRIWKTFPEEELFFGTLTSASCNQKSEKKSYIKAHKRVTAHNYPFLRYPSLLSASPLPFFVNHFLPLPPPFLEISPF